MDEDTLIFEMGSLIFDRSQMTRDDADDLAWDLLNLVKQRLS